MMDGDRMKEIVINKEKLKPEEVTHVVDKARIVLKNEDSFVLSHFERCYFLPGGKIELNETPVETIKRECKEETNINILLDDVEPYLLIKHYLRDYESKDGTIVNRLINTYYFSGFTSKSDIEYFNLTIPEKKDDLRSFFINMDEAKELLKEYNKENPKATYLAIETLKALEEYENLNIN